ncbi:GDSL esterase/lipase At5g42170-like [Typha latifolia]|uniref:GDSL esterase/lipase At5g42170-like n=1 Tax=Typha latifolia TaxID=4733 RepID=UPI003C2B7BFD
MVPTIQSQALVGNETAARVPAVIVFGDSIVDPGNNNAIPTLTKCNFPPYGRDFKGQRATGRFSNGKIPTDFIVSQLGVKDYLPAYLDPQLSEQDLLTGVSFASGGAGYDNITAELVSVFTLWDQLEMFKDYKRKIELIAGSERAAIIIRESLYLIFAGSNDLMVTYFTTPLRKSYDLPSYINFIVQSASSFIKDLYNLGARRIAIAGVPPLGCVPEERTLNGGVNRECVETYNQASINLNSELTMELKRLSVNLQGSHIIYMDAYNSLLDLMMHPSNYGFEEATRGCCGTGRVEATILCSELSPFTCMNASTYLFWDSFHPTERAYEIIVAPMIQTYLPLLINLN